MFIQNQLKSWIASIRSKTALPLRIELWNGQHVDLSSETPRVTIRLPTVASARYLLNPSLANLNNIIHVILENEITLFMSATQARCHVAIFFI